MQLLGVTKGSLGKDFHVRARGTSDTFRLIIAIVNRYRTSTALGRLALGIVRRVPEKDAFGEAKAVFDWLRRWKYVKDPHKRELLHTPPRILKQIKRYRTVRDCDDFSILGVSLLLQLGHRVQLRMIGPTPRDFTHIYFADWLPMPPDSRPRWVAMDATMKTKPMGWESPHAIMRTHTF